MGGDTRLYSLYTHIHTHTHTHTHGEHRDDFAPTFTIKPV